MDRLTASLVDLPGAVECLLAAEDALRRSPACNRVELYGRVEKAREKVQRIVRVASEAVCMVDRAELATRVDQGRRVKPEVGPNR